MPFLRRLSGHQRIVCVLEVGKDDILSGIHNATGILELVVDVNGR